jgi:hypothetical protein
VKHVPLAILLTIAVAAGTLAQVPIPMPGDYVFTGPQSISNQPFSSVVDNKHSQTLADGTYIVTETELHLFRDSFGRTRRETYVDRAGVPQSIPAGIVIRDPVGGVNYNLQVQNRLAYANKVHVPDPSPATENAPAIPSPPAVPPTETRPIVTTEDLGTQIMEGVEVHGRRITRTVPTGSQGNDRPMVFTEEEWNCFELRMMMLLTVTDPRFGETIVRATALDRSEPDPALFQVAPDYKIIEISPGDRANE